MDGWAHRPTARRPIMLGLLAVCAITGALIADETRSWTLPAMVALWPLVVLPVAALAFLAIPSDEMFPLVAPTVLVMLIVVVWAPWVFRSFWRAPTRGRAVGVAAAAIAWNSVAWLLAALADIEMPSPG